MTSLALSSPSARAPIWLSGLSLGGLAWNVFGAYQFVRTAFASAADLIASGLTAHQAAVMTGSPAWMTAAFALGVAFGIVGSALLLVRSRAATPVLALSLVAYVALWIGDAAHGVFAAMGAPQVIVLTLVVAIAAGLLAASRHSAARA